jgi:hypothetical protein
MTMAKLPIHVRYNRLETIKRDLTEEFMIEKLPTLLEECKRKLIADFEKQLPAQAEALLDQREHDEQDNE